MRIVFWQNCISPHQMPFITRLADDPRVDEVVVVAEVTPIEVVAVVEETPITPIQKSSHMEVLQNWRRN